MEIDPNVCYAARQEKVHEIGRNVRLYHETDNLDITVVRTSVYMDPPLPPEKVVDVHSQASATHTVLGMLNSEKTLMIILTIDMWNQTNPLPFKN